MNHQCLRKNVALCASMFAVLFCGACNTGSRLDTGSQTQGRPLTSFSQEITTPVHEITLKAGTKYTLDIDVKNTGSDPWSQQGTNSMPVNAGYRWVDDKGTVLPVEGTRATLTHPAVAPGETDHLKLTIQADPKPGTYSLWVSMVQEGVAWFYDKHGSPLVVRVTIT